MQIFSFSRKRNDLTMVDPTWQQSPEAESLVSQSPPAPVVLYLSLFNSLHSFMEPV